MTRSKLRALTLGFFVTLVLVLVMSCGQASGAHNSKCPPAREQQMDLDASRMGFLGDHSFRVPQNLTAMSGFCLQLRDSVAGIGTYSRECLQGFTRQLFTSLLKRGKQQQASLCSSDASKTDFLNKLSCLSDETKIGQFHRVMDASLARYDHIKSSAVKSEFRLPTLCCSYQIFLKDLDETLNRICGTKQEANRFIKKLVTSTTGEFLNLICDDHKSIEECRASAKTRDSLRQLLEVSKRVKAGHLTPQSKSLLPPLLEILDSTT